MGYIQDKIHSLKIELPEQVSLVAVSKFHPEESIREAYEAGQRIFGESKVQELVPKAEHLPKDIEWHFIGHLQTNKIKYIIPFVSLIHSVDSFKLLKEINKEAQKKDRIVDCLLQFHIAEEDTKFGLSLVEADDFLSAGLLNELDHIRIVGVMGMATFSDNDDQVRKEFKNLKMIFDTLKHTYFEDKSYFKHVSMGMSDDYTIAIEEGSTLVRIGSSIFGVRIY